jgi:PAS domain S-box-containing protein
MTAQNTAPLRDPQAGERWWVAARGLALGVVLLGAAALLGWLFDIDSLKRIRPGWVSMNPATIIAFVLCGLAILCAAHSHWPRWLARAGTACAGLAAFIGLVCLARYTVGLDLGFDRVLFASRLDAGEPVPSRMAPNTAVCFVLTSFAIVLARTGVAGWRGLALVLAAVAGIIGLLALIGYANGVTSLSTIGPVISMAVHTALGFVLLSAGIVCALYACALAPVSAGTPGLASNNPRSFHSVQRNTTLGFAAALVVMSVVGIASYMSLSNFISGRDVNDYTREAITKIADLGSALKDAEAGSRGYVITGHVEYLEPYDAAMSTVESTVHDLRTLTVDSTHQQQHLKALESLIADELAIQRRGIELRRDQGFESAQKHVLNGEGKRTMDNIRSLLGAMTNEQQSLLATRTSAVESGARMTIAIISVGSILGFALVGVGAWMIRRDITRRLATERTLLESEERYRFLADSTPQIVWSARADGCLEYYNARWYEYTGVTFEQARDWGWKAVIHPDDLELCIDEWTASLNSGDPFEGEYRFKRGSDGAYRWHLSRGLPRHDENGMIVQWLGTSTDIDDLKRLEAALQSAKQFADEANQAKSDFLAHMSHEIRTPLNGVIGMIDLLLGTDLSDHQRRFGALAMTSAESLSTVINDILDFSKIEAGKLEIVPTDFNLHIVVEDIMKVLAQRAASKGLELACHVEPGVPALVRGDSDRLRQILINLLNNAIKFTESGAVVLRLTPESDPGGSALIRFTVTDTGVGVAKDRIDRLFKAFSQADASTTRVYGGTGLGLVISKQLAELMGGAIGVESEPGRGSTFWFTVDFETPEQPSAAACRKQIDPRTLRVLAVDDNDTQREVLREQVASWGLEAATAPDGEHALRALTEAAARATPFRIALVDNDMPGMDGFELAAAVKSDSRISDTVLMILLSVEAKFEPNQLRAMGFAGHMTKPVRQSQIFDAIMNAIAAAKHDPSPVMPVTGSSTAVREHTSPYAGARVLLAEDNEINQIVAREMLIKCGYCCDIVGDGQKAVDAMQREEYDLILMDCQMPVKDGFDATREIRRLERNNQLAGQSGRRIPIVALTANAMKGAREKCLEAGMDGYASKPINPKELLRTIERMLRGGTDVAKAA